MKRWVDVVALAILAGLASFWLAPDLSHPGIQLWDEAMHQAAARGTAFDLLFPSIFRTPVLPAPLDQWTEAHLWLHKPPLPFWVAALLLRWVGICTWALRSISFVCAVISAWVLYSLGRRIEGRLTGVLAGALYLALPFHWELLQGLFFGDVTDCSVAACVASAMWFLVVATERNRTWLFMAAGACVGLGYLCKEVLALTPIGVVGVLMVGRALKKTSGPSFSQGLTFLFGAVAVGAPWFVYTWAKYPEAFWHHQAITFGHLTGGHVNPAVLGPWQRPVDAVFVELNGTEYAPLPQALMLLAGLVLLWRALARRQLPVVVVSLWLWAAWVVHSVSALKPPAIAWHSVPAGCLAVALLLASATRRPGIAAATVAAAASATWAGLPSLSRLREALPVVLDQSRRVPGPVEGVIATLAALTVVALATRLLRRRWPLALAVSSVTLALGVTAQLALRLVDEAKSRRTTHALRMARSHTRDIGLALSAAGVGGVVFIDAPLAPPDTSQPHEAIFWSGITTYGEAVEASPPRVQAAKAQGLALTFLSPAAEPFELAVPSPATAWLHAYQVGVPAAPPPPPAGLTSLEITTAAGQRAIGWSRRASTSRFDAWVLVIEPGGTAPQGVTLEFAHRDGHRETIRVEPEFNMTPRERHAGKAWVTLPFVGPRRVELVSARLDGHSIQLPPSDAATR